MTRWNTMQRILIIALGLLVIGALFVAGQDSLADFRNALQQVPVGSLDRMLAAIEAGFTQPGFPANPLLSLIHHIAHIPASQEDKESVLLLITRAMEEGLQIEGLIEKGFELSAALEEGLPIDGILLDALKGIAQRSPVVLIERKISQGLVLLRGVRDLLFEKDIFAVPVGGQRTIPSALPAPRFNQLVVQIADAVSDYIEGGGSPFEGHALYELVGDRLRRLPAQVVPVEDVELVLERISPADLTRVTLAAVS